METWHPPRTGRVTPPVISDLHVCVSSSLSPDFLITAKRDCDAARFIHLLCPGRRSREAGQQTAAPRARHHPSPPQTDTPSVNIGDRLGEDTSSSLSANREEQKSQPPSVAWARTRRNSVRFRNSKLRPKSFAHSLPSLGVRSCRNLPLQILAHPVCFCQDERAGKRSVSSRDHMKVTDRRPISDRQASWNSGDPEGAAPTLVGGGGEGWDDWSIATRTEVKAQKRHLGSGGFPGGARGPGFAPGSSAQRCRAEGSPHLLAGTTSGVSIQVRQGGCGQTGASCRRA